MDDFVVNRVIDANLNRAREALRVLEDYARFGLEDRRLAGLAKAIRHDLGEAVRSARLTGVEGWRDVGRDVGRALSTPSEMRRGGVSDVVVAAAKRLGESLRTVEEYAKVGHPELAAVAESLRYRGYELERRLLLRAEARRRFGDVRLYVIVTAECCRQDWLATAELAVEGGADCIQLREKGLPDGELLRRARSLAWMCHDRGALFIVNDRPDVAALSGADGVHVGTDDVPPADARRIVGPGRIVGASSHCEEEALAAAAAGADYVAIGPMFASPTKPGREPIGPDAYRRLRQSIGLPVVAIGGITEDNVATLQSVGCSAVCVCSAVLGSDDVPEAARRLRMALETPAHDAHVPSDDGISSGRWPTAGAQADHS